MSRTLEGQIVALFVVHSVDPQQIIRMCEVAVKFARLRMTVEVVAEAVCEM